MAEKNAFVERYPSWLRWYKKPSYINVKDYASKVNERWTSPRTSFSRERNLSNGSATDIPKRLSLNQILANQTCSPMSLRDFYMYLKHVEYSSENLEFYVWYNDYVSRYNKAQALLNRRRKSSYAYESVGSNSPDNSTLNEFDADCKGVNVNVTLKERDQGKECSDLILNVESLISLDVSCETDACVGNTKGSNLLRRFAKSIATQFRSAGSNQLLNTSPTLAELEESRQSELAAVSALFLEVNSPRELNIPSALRKHALEKISSSTSPRHLKEIADHCYVLLHSCSHRNFLRLGVSNGTYETVCMATTMGIILTFFAFLTVILLTCIRPFRHHSRWEILGLWPMWFIGGGLILSGLRGSCFFFLLFSRRQPLPWERFDDDASVRSGGSKVNQIIGRINLFDRKLHVKDEGLRNLQRKIVMQSLVGGAIFATLMGILVIPLPIWRV